MHGLLWNVFMFVCLSFCTFDVYDKWNAQWKRKTWFFDLKKTGFSIWKTVFLNQKNRFFLYVKCTPNRKTRFIKSKNLVFQIEKPDFSQSCWLNWKYQAFRFEKPGFVDLVYIWRRPIWQVKCTMKENSHISKNLGFQIEKPGFSNRNVYQIEKPVFFFKSKNQVFQIKKPCFSNRKSRFFKFENRVFQIEKPGFSNPI